MQRLNQPKLLSLTVSALLAACSSGSTEQASPEEITYRLQGSVPGTLIEAFCDDGRYFYTHSDNSVPQAEHPFELELPVGLSCRIIMTTGENTPYALSTPVRFSRSGAGSIAFQISGNVDIGFVALATEADPGCLLIPPAPTYDLDCNGVQDMPIVVEVSVDDFEIIEYVVDPLDDDRDELVDAYEDDDDDGIPNYQDDNSGTDDNDGDGIDNDEDDDDDNDGMPDDEDEDDDNDGIDDEEDEDDDNDGVNDEDEDEDDEDDSEEDDEDSEEDESDDDESDEDGSAPISTGDEPSAGRLLTATQCAQCHGTDGFSVSDIDSIAGESRSELIEETLEEADEPENLMGFHGGAYQSLSTELEDIADYLSDQ